VTELDVGLVVAVGSDGSSLLVTAGSQLARRAMGPVAWSALEVLALQARQDDAGALVVVLGVRDLAGQLGVGRDAAANALSTLRSSGVVSAAQQRAGRGRFDGTHHTILLPVAFEPVPASQRRPRKSRPARDAAPTTSLSLFDVSMDGRDGDVATARDESHADQFHQVANEGTKTLHELAFDRMRCDGSEGGTSQC
jgi:hypothetical protein